MHRFAFPATLALVALVGFPTHAADLVIRGARVLTMDPERPEAQAIAVTGERIVAVGSDAEIEVEIDADTKVFDLQGALVLPGFQDAHIHLIWSGTENLDIALWDAASKEDLSELILAGADTGEPWVRGVGWDLSAFPEQTLDAAFLDSLIPDRPAYFAAADGHSAWVNSAALELAGITADTPDPDGGRIERGADGAPQGLLREAAVALVGDLMPPYSTEQVAQGLADALDEARANGITSIIDPKAEDWMLEGYQAALDAGLLTVRVRAAVEVTSADEIDHAVAARARYNSDRLAVNAIKLFADGVIESQTAAMLEPYEGMDFAGDLLIPADEMARIVTRAEQEGLQVHIHAIGDAAVRAGLDAIAAARTVNGPMDLRHQLAHLEVIDPADIPRFAELGAIANFQPLWAYPDSYITELTEPVIGPERSEWLYPIGAVLAAGGRVVGGSDWSVSSMDPLDAIQIGVTRQDPDDTQGRVLTPQHRVTLEDMLKAYTVNAAYAGFREGETGMLRVGMLADIAVLDRDITMGLPTQIDDAIVVLTILGGEVVFQGLE